MLTTPQDPDVTTTYQNYFLVEFTDSTALEQIPVNDLHEICFDYGSGLGRERWARIDDVLSGDGFGSLKMVEIWPESIVQYLPRLNAKGIVELC